MYIKNIAIENIGPIEELAVDLPFKENSDPKPIIFVGKNGSGKTILQSQIIDSFYEFGSALFDDIGIRDGLNRSFYKVSGDINLKTGRNRGFALLKFITNENQDFEYFDKAGEVKQGDFTRLIQDFRLSPNGRKGGQKMITGLNEDKKEKLRYEWKSGAYFYQPAYRYEEPFWKNDLFIERSRFEDKIGYLRKLNKEIEIISSTEENKSYLMDAVLEYSIYSKQQPLYGIAWRNINNILKKIKQKENIIFTIGPRGGYRVNISEEILGGNVIPFMPSIDSLSLGESVLLHLFINIIRHGDALPKPADQIQGIVAIDEIDTHLHTDLQISVLPELLAMFPKIQFIITTHSPWFLLGMKKKFKEDGFEIRNMPNGEIITTERFSEFENAYKVLEETEKFEADLKQKIMSSHKPMVYVEGPTDVKYIRKAYELYGKPCSHFEIEIIGEETKTGTKHSNNIALKNAGTVFRTNLNLLKHIVILLHDPEESITQKEYGNLLYVRKIPKVENNPLEKGIENLFGTDLIKKVKAEKPKFFGHHVVGGEEKDHRILDNQKKGVCDWICKNGTKDDFKNFEKIFEIVSDIITNEKP